MTKSQPSIPSIAVPFLWVMSQLYALGVQCHKAFWKNRKTNLRAPVISIGNLTTGGTGKTPLLIKLASDLLKINKTPAVLSRGYRGVGQGSGVNDEATLFQDRVPGVLVGVGPDRIQSSRKLLAEGPVDVFLLDDGFQHWPLERKLDIVCVDATDPLEAQRLLPLGRLREPLEALARAGLIVLTRTELVSEAERQKQKEIVQKYAPSVPIVTAIFEPTVSSVGEKAIAVSAIGNPESFEEIVKRFGPLVTPLRFLDHHDYTERDLEKIMSVAARENASVVTTEKDWVKLRKFESDSRFSSFVREKIKVIKLDVRFDNRDQDIWNRSLQSALKV